MIILSSLNFEFCNWFFIFWKILSKTSSVKIAFRTTFRKLEFAMSTTINRKITNSFFWVFLSLSSSFTQTSLDNSSVFKWFFSSLWIMITREKNVKKNIAHSLSLANFLSVVLIWRADLKTKWSIMIVNDSSSKDWDNLIKV